MWVSPPPICTGVPAARPVRSATLRSRPPARVPAESSSGSRPFGISNDASRLAAQVPARTSSIWLIAADDGSLAMAPDSL